MKYKKIGIIGAGQLGKMLAESMCDMNLEFVLYDSQADACGRSSGEFIVGAFDDTTGLDRLIAESDIVTCEFENVPTTSLEYIEGKSKLRPTSEAFAVASHRIREKSMFAQLAIPCPASHAVDSFADLQQAGAKLGYPFVLKTCSGGYDGKGQVVIESEEALVTSYEPFNHLPCIAEQWIDFVEEVSCILVRSADGQIRTYPLTQNKHKDGILQVSIPQLHHPAEEQAVAYTQRIAEHLDYVGVLTLECFVRADQQILANEIAPRVHNSGHWTIEGSQTSQFENHIRAILDMPLGNTELKCPSAMVNLLGCMPTITSDSQTFVHAYGKQIKPKRKVGHITLLADDDQILRQRVETIYSQIYSQS